MSFYFILQKIIYRLGHPIDISANTNGWQDIQTQYNLGRRMKRPLEII
jgi:hypothetical protein